MPKVSMLSIRPTTTGRADFGVAVYFDTGWADFGVAVYFDVQLGVPNFDLQ